MPRYVVSSDIEMMREFVRKTDGLPLRRVSDDLGLSTAFVYQWRLAFKEDPNPQRSLHLRCKAAVEGYLERHL